MEIGEFEVFITKARADIRGILMDYSENNRKDRDNLDRTIIKYFRECSSKFEEDTLLDIFQEEYLDYLKGLLETKVS